MNPRGYKNHTQHEIKNMDMLRRQVWIGNDDKFIYIVKNSQRGLELSVQYENHRYTEEFTKQYNVIFIYVTCSLEREADSNFSLSDIWNLFQESNNINNFCRHMINCMEAWDYLQKISDIPLNTEIIK